MKHETWEINRNLDAEKLEKYFEVLGEKFGLTFTYCRFCHNHYLNLPDTSVLEIHDEITLDAEITFNENFTKIWLDLSTPCFGEQMNDIHEIIKTHVETLTNLEKYIETVQKLLRDVDMTKIIENI